MENDPLAHYNRNKQTYDQIADSLSSVRQSFVTSDRFQQKVMLYDSTVFAVLSVQNSVDILERAFRGYTNADGWDDVREVCKHVNYGNNKFRYIRENFDAIFGDDGDEIIEQLEQGRVWTAVETIVDSVLGVSWIKAAFVPAMLGFTGVLCIDTNVAQMHPSDKVQAEEYKSATKYKEAVDMILDQFPELSDELSPFMVQWVVFDTNRESGVELHEEWFEEMLPGSPFARQAGLDQY